MNDSTIKYISLSPLFLLIDFNSLMERVLSYIFMGICACTFKNINNTVLQDMDMWTGKLRMASISGQFSLRLECKLVSWT